MSYNGSGTFVINTTGQPVVAGTVISSSAFNSLTNDLATGLTTAITKDGQTTTTARITFAQGITSSLVTDSSSTSTGSIITAGGAGIAKNLYVGVNANVAGTLGVTGVATFSSAPIYSSLTASSAVATDASKGLVSVTNTGTGNNVLATSPTLVTPILGTPTSATLTNATGLPLSTGVTGTLPEANGGTGTTTGYYGFKNRIINGAMVIDQRNAGASKTPAHGEYTLDRWRMLMSALSKYSVQQNAGSVTPPAGFTTYLGITSLAATTVSSGDYYWFDQQVEGYNIADLNFGTANSSTASLSFWVRSSLTGNFGGSIICGSGSFPFQYAIASANTWTKITVAIPANTSYAPTSTTNGVGVNVIFSLGMGSSYSASPTGAWQGSSSYLSASSSVNVVGTSGATLYITGVQLEKGSTATSFDYRPYGTELALCQRYYFKNKADNANAALGGVGAYGSTTTLAANFQYPVPMRSAPTASQSGCSNSNGTTASAITSITTSYYGNSTATVQFVSGASFIAAQGGYIYGPTTSAYVDFSAEL